MRDRRFVAEHRGGPLKKAQHFQLILWACACVEHALPQLGMSIDPLIIKTLDIARSWTKANASVGDARAASVAAHAAARNSKNKVEVSIFRAAGHSVATAHMADHSLGGALYALQALSRAGKSIEAEREWQNEQLPEEIKSLVLETREQKEKVFSFK